MIDHGFLTALFEYVKPNDSVCSVEWTSAQYEELQLQVGFWGGVPCSKGSGFGGGMSCGKGRKFGSGVTCNIATRVEVWWGQSNSPISTPIFPKIGMGIDRYWVFPTFLSCGQDIDLFHCHLRSKKCYLSVQNF